MTKLHVILLRRLSGLSMKEFADRVGCSYQHINAIERGVYRITPMSAAQITRAFDLKTEDLAVIAAYGAKLDARTEPRAQRKA